MPAILDDPSTPTIYRQSGAAPFPDAATPLPASIVSKPVTLRDRTTKATLIPFGSADRVPLSLVEYLCAQMNSEIERGDTYPMMEPFSVEAFGRYWFQNFAAIMVLGDVADDGQGALWRWEADGAGWDKLCLGSFYIKPNYPGRSSHVCNAGFVVTDGARNRGVGKLMGECYLEWAPLLGYTYSVFNLVYETNVASCRIWDALGFKRIGRVPGCGNLKTQPEGHFVDAIIYGRHLGYNKEDADDERRFERIKYYLLTGKYPGDADSAEKNRLRAAVRNYTLVELMLGDKEVISDPRQQYEIARQFHRSHHAGINKTTANVSEKYHWNRIKGTVTDVIENCAECGEKQHALYSSFDGGGGGGGVFASSAADTSYPPASASASASTASTASRTSVTQTGHNTAPNGFAPASTTPVVEPDPALPPPLHPPMLSNTTTTTAAGPHQGAFGHENHPHPQYPYHQHQHQHHHDPPPPPPQFFFSAATATGEAVHGGSEHQNPHPLHLDPQIHYRPPDISPSSPSDVDAQLAHALAHDLARDDSSAAMALDLSILEADAGEGERGGLG
ncbi:histone acetyltransferase Spt10 [Phyllosticta citrichinensis]|uniref:Histone acetyltransferase Spt10 n=1 Tax=Phyllosticta citrichinensis TaxID=1130410 RepID=A0ABR1Y5H2_9PEZI